MKQKIPKVILSFHNDKWDLECQSKQLNSNSLDYNLDSFHKLNLNKPQITPNFTCIIGSYPLKSNKIIF